MRERIILLASILIFTTSGILFGQVTSNDAWINEFHYDNDGTDVNEFVEVVIKNVGSYNLNDFTLTLYNGSNGSPYGTAITIDTFTSSQNIGDYTIYYYVFPENGLQNGGPDGLSIDYQGNLIQFLSYEGDFNGVGGPADGMLSEDVGVSESGGVTAPEGSSLQLTGAGYAYEDFNWIGPEEDSPGALNTGQYLFPTLEFNVENAIVNESEGAVNIPVKIINPGSNAIVVDVVFQENPSTAEASDFSSSTTQTVSFGTGAADNEIQNASFTLNNDSDYEGLEKAEFILTNISSVGLAEIVGQFDFTLTIEDDETPNVVINEFLADPGGIDVDGNGTTNGSSDDEFIEILNTENVSVDVSGWKISDNGTNIELIFPNETILPPYGAIVVFSYDTDDLPPVGSFGGSKVFSTDGSLALNNGGDTPTLLDNNDNIIDSYNYSSSNNGVSFARHPEGTGTFTDHDEISGAVGNYSPGTKSDGSQFTAAIILEGNAGWRMLSAPVENMPVSEITDVVPIQGIDNSDDINFFTGYNGTVFTAPADLSGNLNSGEGFILYVFNNNDFSSKTLPVYIDVGSNSEPSGDVSVSLHASGDHWNLLGNPYQTAFDVTSITPTGGALGSAVGHIWSNADGSYILTSSNGDKVAPGQGFFLQNDETTPATSVTLPIAGKTSGTKFYKSSETKGFVQLALLSENASDGSVQKDLSTVLYFHESAEAGADAFDSEKLYPLKPAYSLLGFKNPESDMLKSQDSRPYFGEGKEHFEIEVMAINVKETHTIKWERANNIPEEWEFMVVDNQTGEEVVMDENFVYSFQHKDLGKAKNNGYTVLDNPVSVNNIISEPRFTIILNRGTTTSIKTGSTIPEQYEMEQNYPNPFNPTTQIRYEVASQGNVRIEVFNLMGQKVATLVDRVHSPGAYRTVWDASKQSSGVYFYRLKADKAVMTRKMTLIK